MIVIIWLRAVERAVKKMAELTIGKRIVIRNLIKAYRQSIGARYACTSLVSMVGLARKNSNLFR